MRFLKIFQRKNNDADKFFKEQKTAQKSSRGLFFSKTMTIPKTAQDTIPFVEAYDNGLFLVDEDTYTLIFAFENIDYSLLRDEEQYDCYEKYQKLLNALPTDISYQEFIMNSNLNLKKLEKVLSPKTTEYGTDIYDDYLDIMQGCCRRAENASSEKIMLIAMTYKPYTKMDNANVLFKYYHELQNYFAELGSDTKQLFPEEVFKILHEYYHPFDNIEFLLPDNIFSKGGRIKDYIAPSMFAFKAKDIEMGMAHTRILYVKRYDRELNDEFIRDLVDNNSKIAVSKQIVRLEKREAMEKVRKEIFAVQEQVQRRKENNHKSGTDFVPFRLTEKVAELEELQKKLSDSTCELFELGIFISVSAPTLEELNSLTQSIRSKAMRHQIVLDVLVRQQDKAMTTVLPFATNKFRAKNGNNVNTYLLSDAMGVLIPFSYRTYFAENGLFYGMNKTTDSTIILDRTSEMNSNGFVLGASGSGKSMFVKSEIWDVLLKYPDDELIVIDPENEYLPLVNTFHGERLQLSASSPTKMNIFDTDLSYVEDGQSAIAMKSELIMTIVETAKGSKLTGEERSIIDRCVNIVYSDFINSNGDKDKIPTLKEFYYVLKEQEEIEAQGIANVIQMYAVGNFNTFSEQTNIETNSKFLVIDIFSMGEQLRAVGLQIVLEYIWQRVIENKKRGVRTWVWIDEFSMMFNDSSSSATMSGDFFAKVYKRIRKHGGVATAITQNITEILESSQATSMISNSEFAILLQQKNTDLAKLVSLFELSPSQASYLKTGEKGSGLIISGKKVIPFRKEIPKNSIMYKISSTDFKEQQKKILEKI